MTKPCSVCGGKFPDTEFYVDSARADGLKAACRKCYNERRRAERYADYGTTPEEFDALLAAQAGGCAICGKGQNGRRLDVDHDHITGKVRGLLCRSCNTTLGRLHDEPDLFRLAATYLETAVFADEEVR